MMSDTNTGGPAFPLQSIGPDFAPGYSGMTLRDYFAAKAMQAHAAAQWASYYTANANENEFTPFNVFDESDLAEMAYGMADEMLKARDAK
jgi:hypothetical protein